MTFEEIARLRRVVERGDGIEIARVINNEVAVRLLATVEELTRDFRDEHVRRSRADADVERLTVERDAARAALETIKAAMTFDSRPHSTRMGGGELYETIECGLRGAR